MKSRRRVTKRAQDSELSHVYVFGRGEMMCNIIIMIIIIFSVIFAMVGGT